MIVLAIDPGTTRSAFVALDIATGMPKQFGINDNEVLLDRLRRIDVRTSGIDVVAIEKIANMGMAAVGESIFETVWWSGRFAEAVHPMPIERITRGQVKQAICGSAKAKDPNVRQALIDRFGGIGGKAVAIGLKKTPGPLYGISADMWAALAVAITFADRPR